MTIAPTAQPEPGPVPKLAAGSWPAAPRPAPPADIQRVVVIGAGVAGITAVFELRALQTTVEATLVGADPYDVYNRMAIGTLPAGATTIDTLYMTCCRATGRRPGASATCGAASRKPSTRGRSGS